MTYAPALITRFGGLQLSTDPREVSMEQSVSGANCTLGLDRSYLRSRDGMIRFGAVDAMTGTQCTRLVPGTNASGEPVLLAVSAVPDIYVDSYATSGAVTALGSWSPPLASLAGLSFCDAAAIGLITGDVQYLATSGATLRKHSLGVLATSSGKPKYVGVTATSNRLIQGHYLAAADTPSGSQGSKSTVFFSDPGDPDTYGANNYVILRPGDSEELRGIATWRGQTFIFKQSTVFIFSGESVDGTGEPVFDYRALTLTGRIGETPGPAVVAGAQGVYYLATDGVYRTTGGSPVRVSHPLDEAFRRGTLVVFGLSAVGDRVALHTSNTLYVLDERHGQWTAATYPWQTALCPLATWPDMRGLLSDDDTETFLQGGGATLRYSSGSVATDDGAAVACSYQSGFGDLGKSGIKRLRQTRLTGTGSLTYKVGVDYLALDAGAAATLGGAPTVGTWLDRNARRGRQFSYGVASASGAWRLENLEMHLAGARPVAEVIA